MPPAMPPAAHRRKREVLPLDDLIRTYEIPYNSAAVAQLNRAISGIVANIEFINRMNALGQGVAGYFPLYEPGADTKANHADLARRGQIPKLKDKYNTTKNHIAYLHRLTSQAMDAYAKLDAEVANHPHPQYVGWR